MATIDIRAIVALPVIDSIVEESLPISESVLEFICGVTIILDMADSEGIEPTASWLSMDIVSGMDCIDCIAVMLAMNSAPDPACMFVDMFMDMSIIAIPSIDRSLEARTAGVIDRLSISDSAPICQSDLRMFILLLLRYWESGS